MNLDAQGMLTVLGALRLLQQSLANDMLTVSQLGHFDEVHEPLSDSQINALCDRVQVDGANPQDRIEQLKWLKDKGLTSAECIEIFGVVTQDNSYARRAKAEYEDDTDDVEIDENALIDQTEKGCWVQAWVYVRDAAENTIAKLRELGWGDSDREHEAIECQLNPEYEACGSEDGWDLNVGVYRKSDDAYVGWIDGDVLSATEIHAAYLAGEWKPE